MNPTSEKFAEYLELNITQKSLCYHGSTIYPAAVCVQQVYERAIANVPPAAEKRYWQRYIYLWINYALFEELEAQDADRTREVHRACLKLIPHKAFTFAKVSPIRILCISSLQD